MAGTPKWTESLPSWIFLPVLLLFAVVIVGLLLITLWGGCHSLGVLGRWGSDAECRGVSPTLDQRLATIERQIALVQEGLKDEISQLAVKMRGLEGHLYVFEIDGAHRNRVALEVDPALYPVGSVLGWQLHCAPSSDRDIESIFLEVTEGVWNLYVEHYSDCFQIEVVVGFATKDLALSHFFDRRRKAPAEGRWNIRKLTASYPARS